MTTPLRASRRPDLLAGLLACPFACLFTGLLVAAPACAQPAGLPDPTRPPDSLSAAGSAEAPHETGALKLQSVLSGAGRRPAAVIDGQLVAVGDTVAGLRVSHIQANRVRLQGPQGTTTLTLLPGPQRSASTPPRDLAK